MTPTDGCCRRLTIRRDRFRLDKPFIIARGRVDSVELIVATIEEDGVVGRGECRPYARYGESVESVAGDIEAKRDLIEAGGGRDALTASMTAGAARNALDCALWDLAAKHAGESVFKLAGLAPPKPVLVTYTLGLDRPETMAAEAARVKKPILKLKLGAGDGDVARVEAVRAAAPASRLIVDANEGWNPDQLKAFLPALVASEVEMIEQPLPADQDAALAGLQSPIILCADESCHITADLARLKTLYGMVNIKLDKTGGLSGALELLTAARECRMRVMIGCMMASSLSMAPAQLLADAADYVDLDAPLLLKEDRDHRITFDGAMMYPARPELWG